jgi:hypothetical protein
VEKGKDGLGDVQVHLAMINQGTIGGAICGLQSMFVVLLKILMGQ